MMRTLVLGGLFVPIMASAAPRTDAASMNVDATGTWTVQTEVQGIAINESCALVQSGGKGTGTCDTSTGKYAVTGTSDGKSLNFSHPFSYRGEDYTVSFYGKLDDENSLTGSVDIEPLGAGGPFSGKREPAKP